MIDIYKGDLNCHCLSCGKGMQDDPLKNKPYTISIGNNNHKVDWIVCIECLEKLNEKISGVIALNTYK